MSNSITLNKEHGIAPAMTFCRICGNDTNEIVFFGNSCNKIMRKLWDETDGIYGSKNGYEKYGKNKIPSSHLCEECEKYLDGGFIMIANDTKEYLRLDKESVDGLIGRIVDAKGRVLDFDACRGKINRIPFAWWIDSPEGIRLRDPKEWTT